MLSSDTPTRVPLPFANSGTKNAIPTASQIGITAGAASLTDGFPPLTFTPIAAGGVPPFGADFNGVLNLISQTVRWMQAGGGFLYNSTFSTAVTGYPKGATLTKATLDGTWLNTVEGNTTNPDTGGAGWIDGSSGRLINVQTFLASGTYTPTPGTKSIVIQGNGGGGGGGGCPATSASQQATGFGGYSGTYGMARFTTGFTGGLAVTIGAGGTAGAVGGAGGAGGDTKLGTILTIPGGPGGAAGAASPTTSAVFVNTQSNAVTSTVGGLLIQTLNPVQGPANLVLSLTSALGGGGGDSMFGRGGRQSLAPSSGLAGNGNGTGGSGAAQQPSNSGQPGGAGIVGILNIFEYA